MKGRAVCVKEESRSKPSLSMTHAVLPAGTVIRSRSLLVWKLRGGVAERRHVPERTLRTFVAVGLFWVD